MNVGMYQTCRALPVEGPLVAPAAHHLKGRAVGLAAIRTANYAGATSIALTRSSEKRKQLLEAGAMHVIATGEADLVQEVMRITNGKGARVAFDPVGGPNFPKVISALAPRAPSTSTARLAVTTPLPVLEMIAKMPTIKGHNVWLTSGDPEKLKTAVAYIRRGFDEGKLKPIIDQLFEEIVAAHRYLETSGQLGKIVAVL